MVHVFDMNLWRRKVFLYGTNWLWCRYNNRNGILYIFELLNNLRINIASQYKIIYNEEKRMLSIYLDNGQIVKLTVIRK